MRVVPAATSSVMALSIAAFSAVAFSARVRGQELRGTVMQADRITPASGVVLVMLHETRDDSIIARTVSSERGRFSLKPPVGVMTRLRLLRIGYIATDAGTFMLGRGETRDTTLFMNDVRVQLATVNVKDNARCEVRPDGALRVAKLFDAVKTALISTTVPITGYVSRSDYFTFTRLQDRRGKLLTPVTRTAGSGTTLQAFASIGADSLAKLGYVVEDTDGSSYYAPDANDLISEQFLSQHCLVPVEGKGAMQPYIGIGFRPARRNDVVDVRGTFWVDRESFELQYLEYDYDGLPELTRDAALGGRVDYVQMAHGAWFVSKWAIRMPLIEERQSSTLNPGIGISAGATSPLVVGQHVTGAEVASIKVDEDVLYLNTNAERAGEMPQDRPAEKASAAESVPKSTNFADAAAVARMDSGGIAAVCGVAADPQRRGLVVGRVHTSRNEPVAQVGVVAVWKPDFPLTNNMVASNTMRAEATSNASGAFQLCNIPLDRQVTVSVMDGDRRVRSAVLRLSEHRPATRLDLRVAGQSQRF